MTVGQAFDSSVSYYDDWMKIALPSYDKIFSTALNLISFDENTALKVLDLGAGTGLFSQHVFGKYPSARFVLCDIAPKMLDIARTRFQKYQTQFDFVVEDYRHFQAEEKFDLVISSLSIHHLSHAEKSQLFAKIYHLLNPSGIFINIDQIKGRTPELEDLYWNNWLREVRAKGAQEEQIQASIKRRKEYDQDALLVDQLCWLSEAGFTISDCVYKDFFIGVFFAQKD